MLYKNELFDLANEYDPSTSTFIPKTAGIYLLDASTVFSAKEDVDFQIYIYFEINESQLDVVSECSCSSTQKVRGAAMSEIVQLHAGDEVKVFAQASVEGRFLASTDSKFAARFPSPAE
ncbi:hypothetical protein [Bacillus cereus]|uniref:C1q-like domain-containing protein n=1 Tax=Bacillus cereus TaxID=1396 RepID=UPI003806EE37